MALTVSVAAESRALTTAANIATATGVSGVATATILAASELVVNRLGYDLARETVVETHRGTGRYQWTTLRRPIVAVSAATYDGTSIASEITIEDRANGILFREGGWPVRGKQDVPPYAITYQAGFYLPSFTVPGSGAAGVNDVLLPTWAEHAAIELSKALHQRAASSGGVVTEESTPDYSVRFAEPGVTNLGTVAYLSATAEALLAPHALIGV